MGEGDTLGKKGRQFTDTGSPFIPMPEGETPALQRSTLIKESAGDVCKTESFIQMSLEDLEPQDQERFAAAKKLLSEPFDSLYDLLTAAGSVDIGFQRVGRHTKDLSKLSLRLEEDIEAKVKGG